MWEQTLQLLELKLPALFAGISKLYSVHGEVHKEGKDSLVNAVDDLIYLSSA